MAGLPDLAQATFWGAILIFALLTVYFWFFASPANVLAGIVTLILFVAIAFIGLKGSGSI